MYTMAEIITISIPADSKKLIDAVMKMKPDGASFSKALRLILEEYFRGKSNPILQNKDMLTTTSTMEEWRKLINEVFLKMDFYFLSLKLIKKRNINLSYVLQVLRSLSFQKTKEDY